MYDFYNCPKCQKVLDLYPDLDPRELFNETYIRIIERYKNTPISSPPGLFFMVAKNRAEFLRKRERHDHLPRVAIEWEEAEPNHYKQALDNYLERHPDDPYSNVVRMYLLEPNIAKLSRDHGISKHHLKDHLEIALADIGFEYLKIKTLNS
jgi:hypothetical protein